MKTVTLYLDADEPATVVRVRRLTPKNVIALGQFGKQLMAAGVTQNEIQALFKGGELRVMDAIEMVWGRLADPNAEIGQESKLETSFYLLLQTITGLSADQVQLLTFEDLLLYAEAAMQQEASSRVGGFLRPMISSISPLLLDLFTASTSASKSESPPAASGTSSASDGLSSEPASPPGGGMNSGGSTPSSAPLSIEPDGPLITSSMESPTERPSSSEHLSPALT